MSTSGSTTGPAEAYGTGVMTDRSPPTRARSLDGSTCSSLASVRSDASSIPAMAPVATVLSPTATATASSSSSSSGGIAAPAPSRYPPAGPRVASTG